MNSRAAPLLAGALLIALAGGLVDWRPVSERRPNVLLISIDTLRADHLGYDGYARDTSPNLDRLAARSRRYREAWAPAPWTLPSHAGLLTGRHPRALGIEDRDAALPENAPSLASSLRRAGYRTAAFVDSMPRGFVGGERGFGRGFETYVHLPAESASDFRYDAAITVERAATWLAHTRRDRPFFLFLHTKSVHALPAGAGGDDPRAFPYDKPEPWRSRYLSAAGAELSWDDAALGRGVGWLRGWNEAVAAGEQDPTALSPTRRKALEALYDAGIRYVDHQIARLLDSLESHGFADDTIIVVTADHGEAFVEHDLLLHKELYRDVLRVPLLVYMPWEAEGRDVRSRVTLMDVAPTILRAVDAPIPPEVSGRVLPEADRAPSEAEPLFTYYRSWPDGYYEAYGVREGTRSLIHHRLGRGAPFRSEWFDLAADPAEQHPLPAGSDAQSGALLAQLRAWMETGANGARSSIELDAETRRHLEALGYGQ
ncbi:MAG: sulfatase [Deltaproteobacteria bacterium]|nr:sulfatase [Deltaproteobacteria bacterium]MBW2444683.1 sulfatase [Deltaproteobacteria bacterium]